MVIEQSEIIANVKTALTEDVGSGDITAELIPAEATASATLITREHSVLAGCAWFDEVFNQLDSDVKIEWLAKDGDVIVPNQKLCEIAGSARSILTGERTAINFLQTLSATATSVASFVALIKNTESKILDTRKTIPGLRLAQKYAVTCGGGKNHRIGLYDAILIKENHIIAAGSIAEAIGKAKQLNVPVEVEVESLKELEEALEADPDQILLDNFNIAELIKAVLTTKGRAKLEASGNVDKQSIRAIAETGVDYISIGALTKHVQAIDFSMRINL
ncbi:MAG TPA: carboxylating nicotinate-nucleotide diphosphorylase [Thiotrichaceae bacterium]|nr:carboxylating nicotinate-nucleotide diphosphorylase [Thiotrichaceae bacterium]HIM07765.1 carboxylating nicotinate-nucleotide diphosphorylase [Gammaproteobacteria bacterium]